MNEYIEKGRNLLMGKLVMLAIMIFVSWVATLFVWNVIQEREQTQNTASAEVAQLWGRAQIIAGPVLSVPVEKTLVSAVGEPVIDTYTLFILPKKLNYQSEVVSQVRSRGIYDTPVYTATVKGDGAFDLSDVGPEVLRDRDTKILWDKAEVSINLSDTRGVTAVSDLAWGDTKAPLLPSSKFSVLEKSGMHTRVEVDPQQPQHQFSFEFLVRGSNDLSFLPLGENTAVQITSDWSAPSFRGEFLPENREVTADGFSATWVVSSFGKNTPQYWLSSSSAVTDDILVSKAFGVGLYQEVDFYTMVDRATKYSILFISLTFLTFFMYEVLAGLRIHPVQYLLVGFAIALFYLLLLSFAEVVGFLPAYLIASVATTTLITGYCLSILKVKGRAFLVTVLLLALYTYLYILLQLQDLSLLFGSLLLFLVLTTVMYITRNFDWYALGHKG